MPYTDRHAVYVHKEMKHDAKNKAQNKDQYPHVSTKTVKITFNFQFFVCLKTKCQVYN